MAKIAITGVSKGLGYVMAKELTALGYSVAGCSRSGTGPKISFCGAADVSDINSVRAWADEMFESFGVPDILVNNAAVMNTPASLWETDPVQFKKLIDINVTGSFNVIHAVFPEMLKLNKGIVVNMSSGWGRFTSPDVAPYCTSKFAIEGMSEAMSKEVPKGMAVVSLNPGFINTDMVKGVFGSSSGAEDPEAWGKKAAKYIQSINASMNGMQLTVS